MSENFTVDQSLLLIIDRVVNARKFERTGYNERFITELEKAKSMIDETIEDFSDDK